jgi:lambda repressor-like predicted transcriptional regulator
MTPRTPSIRPADIPADHRERGQWIIGQLKLRGTSLRKLSLSAGYDASYVSQALTRPLQPAEALIATALGTTEAVLFPERHDRIGQRLNRRNPSKSRRADPARNGKARGIA